jgi:hypothetical protein
MEIEGFENPLTKFMPCDVVVTPEGAIFIADGYGSDRIYEMTFEDQLVRQWGGRRARGQRTQIPRRQASATP